MAYEDDLFTVKSGRPAIDAHKAPCNQDELQIHDFCISNKPEYQRFKMMADLKVDKRFDVNDKGQYVDSGENPLIHKYKEGDDASVYDDAIQLEESLSEGAEFFLVKTPSGLAEYVIPQLAYVNAYMETQEFGGPEEGGWWYKAGEPLASVPVIKKEDVDTIEKILKRSLQPTEQKGEYSHVMGGLDSTYEGDYSGDDTGISHSGTKLKIFVEPHKAKNYPKHRPRYE